MNINCVNCGLEFVFEAPASSGGGPLKARCPRCGHGNDVMEVPGGGGPAPGGGMGSFGMDSGPEEPSTGGFPSDPPGGRPSMGAEEVFCFNCGKPMQPNPNELIPVCDECKAGSTTGPQPAPPPPPGPPSGAEASAPPPGGSPSRASLDGEPSVGAAPAAAGGGGAELMVRKSNGQVYGPFPKETVLEWVRSGKILPDEEVSKIGGAWRIFSRHEEFSQYFPEAQRKPASSESKPQAQEIQFKKVSAVQEGLRSVGKIAFALVFILIVGGLAYFLISRGTLALPDKVLDSASDALGSQDVDEDLLGAARGRTRELIEDLQATHAPVQGTSFEHYYRAQALMQRGNRTQMAEAIVEMEKAVAADPTNAAALAGVGDVYNKYAELDEASGELQRKSFYFIDYALEQGEYQLEANRAKAWFLYFNGQYQDAVGYADGALNANPEDPETHMLKGMIAFAQGGKLDTATLAHFREAEKADPGYDQVHYELGRCYEQVGMAGDAIREFQAKIEADPGFIGAHFALGSLYEEIGDYAAAVASYDQVLALDPSDVDAILRLGRINNQVVGDPKRAGSLYLRLTGDGAPELGRKQRLELALGQASALRQLGEPGAACQAADEAIEIEPTSVAAYFEKGMCEAAREDFEASLRAFGKATTLAGEMVGRDRSQLAFFQGIASLQAKQYPDAIDAFDSAIAADETFVPAYVFKAGIYAELGQADQVKSSLAGLRKIDPVHYRREVRTRAIWAPTPPMGDVCTGVGGVLSGVNFDPELYGMAGLVCYHAGDGRRASSYLSRSLEDDPRNWAGLLYSSLLALDAEDTGKATRYTERLTREHRDVGVFFLYRGMALEQADQLDQASQIYGDALIFDRELVWAHHRLGMVYLEEGRAEEAEKQFEQAHQRDPALTEPHRMIFESQI